MINQKPSSPQSSSISNVIASNKLHAELELRRLEEEGDLVKLTPGLDPTHLGGASLAAAGSFASGTFFRASEDDLIIRRGVDQLNFTLPLNSPLLKSSSTGATQSRAHPGRQQSPLPAAIINRTQLGGGGFNGLYGFGGDGKGDYYDVSVDSIFFDRLQTPLAGSNEFSGAPGLNNSYSKGSSSQPQLPGGGNNFLSPGLTARSLVTHPINSPYTRMCTQLENFVDTETDVTDCKFIRGEGGVSRESIELAERDFHDALNESDQEADDLSGFRPSSLKHKTPHNVATRSLWLGNVDPTVMEEDIRRAFESFGSIESIRLLPAKECAFVNYFDVEAALEARHGMQGKPLGNMILKIGFGRIDAVGGGQQGGNTTVGPSVHHHAANTNTHPADHNSSRSVWIGNIGSDVGVDLLMAAFSPFGSIESCRILETKSCAFVNFYSWEPAALARQQMNGVMIGSSVIKTGHAKDGSGGNQGNSTSNPGFSVSTASCAASFYTPFTLNPSSISKDPILSLMKNSHQSASTATAPSFASITAGKQNYNAASTPGSASASSSSSSASLSSSDLDGGALREYRRAVEANPSQEIPRVLEILRKLDLAAVAIDGYGNILLQRIIEKAGEEDQMTILAEITAEQVPLVAMHKNGTWVIQKLINAARAFSVQEKTIGALLPHIPALLEDQFGNYVVQAALQTNVSSDQTLVSQMIDAICKHIRKLAIGRFSSRALKSVLETSPPPRQRLLAAAIAKEAAALSVDPNGSVVIQWILDSDIPGRVALITAQLRDRLAVVALTKQGSVIVARIVASSEEPIARETAILELFELTSFDDQDPSAAAGNGPNTSTSTTSTTPTALFQENSQLRALLTEPSTCSIILKAYHMSKPAHRARLAQKLTPQLLDILKQNTGECREEALRRPNQELLTKIPIHLVKLHAELIMCLHD